MTGNPEEGTPPCAPSDGCDPPDVVAALAGTMISLQVPTGFVSVYRVALINAFKLGDQILMGSRAPARLHALHGARAVYGKSRATTLNRYNAN